MCESDEQAIPNLRTITLKINPHRPLGQCLSLQADWERAPTESLARRPVTLLRPVLLPSAQAIPNSLSLVRRHVAIPVP